MTPVEEGNIPPEGMDVMVKIRMQGTKNELKRMRRIIERNRNLRVVSVSEVLTNKGTKKYYRQYIDISFNLEKKVS